MVRSAVGWGLLVLAGCAGILVESSAPATPLDPGDSWMALRAGGRVRTALVHVPRGANGTRAMPLVIVLHSHGGHAGQIRDISRMSELADAAGFVVVYPNGTSWMNGPMRSWNAGRCCGYAMHAHVDDVGFLRDLVERLAQRVRLDPARIYAAGLSNGAMMAHRLACDMADRIAGIAPIAGAWQVQACEPSEPVAVMIVHGTRDRLVPYAGGESPSGRMDPPVADAVAFWVRHNRCDTRPTTTRSGSVHVARYGDGLGGSEVVLATIEEGGHAWPGGERGWWFGAEPIPGWDAAARIWEFFERHPKTESSQQSAAGTRATL